MAEEDFDGDDILDEADGEVETSVQLGFAFDDEKNALFASPNWREWDGGKIGGQPVWLDPVHLPSQHDLACVHCGSPMTFVLQIYCPLDEVNHAFHRSMYVFVCRKKSCVENGSVKCLRCQLPKLNQFYPFNPDESTETPKSVGYVESMPPKLCAVCGQRGPQSCSRCKSINYCSREHQRSHWKYHKLHCGTEASASTTNDFSALVLPEYSLEVSQEILCDRADDALDETVLKAKIWEDATVPENVMGDDDDDDDEDDDAALTQSDYNKALGNEEADPLYTKFMERIRRGGGDQVLRYSRWDEIEGPLKLSSLALCGSAAETSANANTISLCPHCGSKRKFEFQVGSCPSSRSRRAFFSFSLFSLSLHRPICLQIMPQLLHYLRVDRKTKVTDASKALACLGPEPPPEGAEQPMPAELESIVENKTDEDIDWGMIDVYTCTASCAVSTDASGGDHCAYLDEGVSIQKPVDFKRRSPLKK